MGKKHLARTCGCGAALAEYRTQLGQQRGRPRRVWAADLPDLLALVAHAPTRHDAYDAHGLQRRGRCRCGARPAA